ncbi:MAG: PDZ domain-containing protein [Polyangiaceae bacterium]|jgi:predicted metalloprotease with PDZ domain
MARSIVHHVRIPAPQVHLVHVETRIATTEAMPEVLVVFMPVWTPGSYLIREYARHVEGFFAGPPARARKIRKNAWEIRTHATDPLVIQYTVYAAELTVRTSHVDESHGFLVGAATFFGVEGWERVATTVEIHAPDGWRTFTSLDVLQDPAGSATQRFVAKDFDTLVDCPIEIGRPIEEAFDVLGTPHRYAVCPASALRRSDLTRLIGDTKTIVETEAALFGGTLPYEHYDLLLHLSTRGRGGLEHRSSAALIAAEASFATREAYLDLLSLVAHEIFHAWNVKRIRPAGLTPYGYNAECYTRLLWWFEGGTSYYDWRVLALARICTLEEYLDHLASEIAYLDQTAGRLVHALEDASWDAWIKLYRPDENSQNSSVSYYRKGEVVCALLDLEIRARSGGRASLDGILVHLWREYGTVERSVPEDEIQAIFERATGVDLGDLFETWIRSPTEIDYAKTLAYVGLAIERTARPDAAPCSLGVRVRADGPRAMVSSVSRGTAAWRAGVDGGDEILAIGGVRIEGGLIEPALRSRAPGDSVDIVLARDGRLVTKTAILDPGKADRVKIVPARDASDAARQAFAAWLDPLKSTARPRTAR